jgi:hypothetical protein
MTGFAGGHLEYGVNCPGRKEEGVLKAGGATRSYSIVDEPCDGTPTFSRRLVIPAITHIMSLLPNDLICREH